MTDEVAVSDRVRRAIQQRGELVNEAVVEEVPIRRPERLYEASRYLVEAGGKRLRPAVVMLVGEMLVEESLESADYREFPALHGGSVDLLAAAVSVEIVHLFTLIHDDIMDDDDFRRGVPTVHQKYDLETAILAGDTLYSTAFEVMLRTGAPAERMVEALDRLARTCTRICEGQAMDVGFETAGAVTLEDYREMIELKTAVLYGAAAAIPGVLLGASEADVESLYQFGVDVGQGFQIQDDVLDLVGDRERIGKDRGSDLIEGKQTIITVHARDHGVDLSEFTAGDSDIEAAVAALEDAGSIEYARSTAEELIETGKRRLDSFPDTAARDRLWEIADFFIERTY